MAQLKKVTSFFFLTALSLLHPKVILADSWVRGDETNPDPAQFSDLETVFSNVVGLFIPIAGLVVFTMLIVGGFKFLTSGGDPKNTAAASQTLTWAVLGLLFLIGARFFLKLVTQLTGYDVTSFEIPS